MKNNADLSAERGERGRNMKKYELTGETKEYNGVMLHRIRAIKDFGSVKAGDLGGWIEKEENYKRIEVECVDRPEQTISYEPDYKYYEEEKQIRKEYW